MKAAVMSLAQFYADAKSRNIPVALVHSDGSTDSHFAGTAEQLAEYMETYELPKGTATFQIDLGDGSGWSEENY